MPPYPDKTQPKPTLPAPTGEVIILAHCGRRASSPP
jgi:hypothetical protein